MATTARRRSRIVDLLLLLPALGVGVLLLAVFVADRTGASLADLLQPDAVTELVPAAFTSDGR
jgi:hypothetical protein